MSRNNNQNKPQHIPSPPLDPSTIQTFVSNQTLQLQNEARELQIREKELEVNAKLASESMKHQAEYMNSRPSEGRKTVTRVAWITGLLMLLVMLFILALFHLEKDDFANKVLQLGGHVLTLFIGYYFGRRKGLAQGKNGNDVSSNEIND